VVDQFLLEALPDFGFQLGRESSEERSGLFLSGEAILAD
jgi:hypothetical protein